MSCKIWRNYIANRGTVRNFFTFLYNIQGCATNNERKIYAQAYIYIYIYININVCLYNAAPSAYIRPIRDQEMMVCDRRFSAAKIKEGQNRLFAALRNRPACLHVLSFTNGPLAINFRCATNVYCL
jgi:hypothetical protein